MTTVLIVVHIMIVIALVATVLLQRSEGGALGIGGGGGNTGGFMSGRGASNMLTRTTALLAAGFFLTSIGLTLLARHNVGAPSILDDIGIGRTEGSGGVLDTLRDLSTPSTSGETEGSAVPVAPTLPQVPQSE